MLAAGTAFAQQTTSAPPTDAAAESSPATTAAVGRPEASTDTSAEASPIHVAGSTVAAAQAHAVASVHLRSTVNSATLHNGAHLMGSLVGALPRMHASPLPPGTPVQLTVIAVAPAGKITSFGEITLQLTHAGPLPVFTLPETFRGVRGRRELPDSAPTKGGEAIIGPGATLRFTLQPPPAPAAQLPRSPHIGTPQPVPQP